MKVNSTPHRYDQVFMSYLILPHYPLFQFSLTCLTWRMSHVILIDTLDHIRDLETYLIHCRDAINDIDEDLEMFNNMKDAEIMVLVQQRARHNQQAETRKHKIVKEIQTISEKIRNLTGTLESHNGDADIERVLTPSEITAKERPQGLNIDVWFCFVCNCAQILNK